MSVGIGIKGLEVVVTVGTVQLLGQTTKGLTCNNEALDTTSFGTTCVDGCFP